MVRKIEYKCRNAKVYFRFAPNVAMSWDYVKVLSDKKTVYVRCLQDFLMGNMDAVPNYWCFETDGFFYNDSQQYIYQTIMPDVLRGFLDGANASIIAYGATGTGKSLTISGVESPYEDRGFVFRALEDLIKLREGCKDKMKVVYSMMFIEATNTHVYDLLRDDVPAYDTNSMKLLKNIPIRDLQSALLHVFKGEGRKTIVQKASYNSHSSHSVLTITASCRLNDEIKPLQVVSKLHFVDLAGVDTIGNKSCFYKNVIEIGMANVTKTQIEQFILTLIENITENIIVKQKLNILIQYLGDAISHSSQMRLVGHIRTGRDDLMITLSMLRLGSIIRGLKGKKSDALVKETAKGRIQHLQSTVKAMRQELEIQSMILNSTLSKNLTQDRLSHLQQLAESYLSNQIDELVVVSFSDVNTILNVFKERFLDLEAKKKEELDATYRTAYEAALQSFKASSRSSSFKKMPSLKSKESITQSQSSRTSKRSLSWKGSKMSSDSKSKKGSPKESMRQSLSARRPSPIALEQPSKIGSKIVRRSPKKRSSVASDTRDEISEAIEQPLPDDIPDFQKAWSEFRIDEKYDYANLKAQLEEDEKTAKDTNMRYLNEIRNLQDMQHNCEEKKEALRLAQMGREIVGAIALDEDGNIKISDAETEYKKVIKEMDTNVVEQQEKLLQIQTELRLQLEICRQGRKSINEQYEQFCSENYKTLLPDLKQKSTEIPDELLQQSTEVVETKDKIAQDLAECYNNLVRHEWLKTMMDKQKLKMKRRELRNRKWIRSCKP